MGKFVDFLMNLSQKWIFWKIQVKVQYWLNTPLKIRWWEELKLKGPIKINSNETIEFRDGTVLSTVYKQDVLKLQLSKTENPPLLVYSFLETLNLAEIKHNSVSQIFKEERKGRDLKFEIQQTEEQILLVNRYQSINLRIEKTNRYTKLIFSFDFNRVFGLGDKIQDLKRKGEFTFWNLDNPHYNDMTDNLYQSHPNAIIQSPETWINLIVDYPGYQKWTINSDSIQIIIQSRDFTVYLSAALELKSLYQKMTTIVGTFDLPPVWAIGYQQSRWSYPDHNSIVELDKKFEEHNIPCDVFYLDIDYMDSYKCFTINRDNFPDLRNLSLKIEPRKIVTIIDPGIKKEEGYEIYETGVSKGYFLRQKKDGYYSGVVWPGICNFPDFLDDGLLDWWFNNNLILLNQGVAGIWNDMNEPSIFSMRRTFPSDVSHTVKNISHQKVHNIYGLMMSRATNLAIRKASKNRPFVLTRSSYLGGQNFAWMWTGDNSSSWDHLRWSVKQIISMNLTGYVLCGADVGGFSGNCNSKLLQRWTQLGVFYPFFRNHSALGTIAQEPWKFDNTTLQITKKAIELRYELAFYIYTCFYLAQLGVEPIIQPLFMQYSTTECFDPEFCETQFFFGSNLLITPLLSDENNRRVYLPPGMWYDYYTGQKLEGGQIMDITVQDDQIPIYIRENTVLPISTNIGRTMEETLKNDFTIRLFGNNPKGMIYFDGLNHQNLSEYCLVQFKNLEFELLNFGFTLNKTGENSFKFEKSKN